MKRFFSFIGWFTINSADTNRLATLHIFYVHLIDDPLLLLSEQREIVIRPAANDFLIVDVLGAHKCRASRPDQAGSIYRVALIGMNVSTPPPLAFTWNMKILLRPAAWITTWMPTRGLLRNVIRLAQTSTEMRGENRTISLNKLSYIIVIV